MKKLEATEKFDVAVIGGGPAGLMAAGRAAVSGARVVLIEKNERAGRKLLLTGNGRCNLANAEFDLRALVKKYGDKGKFLWHALAVFGPREMMDFFEQLGVATKSEDDRIFPQSDKAEEILAALEKYLAKNKVTIIDKVEVLGVEKRGRQITKIKTRPDDIMARSYIFCTGGAAHPETGSAGAGFKWAAGLGHRVEKLYPALTPMITKEPWVKELAGISLPDVRVGLWQNKKLQAKERGDCLFAHFGLSGPAILNISGRVGPLLARGEVRLSIDCLPDLAIDDLDQISREQIESLPNKAFQNCLTGLVPRKLISIVAGLVPFDPEKPAGAITREQRQSFARGLKKLDLAVAGIKGFDEAMVTSGGVALEEIDDKTMRSKIIDNLYFAGEILGIAGPSGGFNLQVCWSTGYLAGESAGRISNNQ